MRTCNSTTLKLGLPVVAEAVARNLISIARKAPKMLLHTGWIVIAACAFFAAFFAAMGALTFVVYWALQGAVWVIHAGYGSVCVAIVMAALCAFMIAAHVGHKRGINNRLVEYGIELMKTLRALAILGSAGLFVAYLLSFLPDPDSQRVHLFFATSVGIQLSIAAIAGNVIGWGYVLVAHVCAEGQRLVETSEATA